MLHQELAGKIITSFYKVYNTLGHGFLEKVYGNALALELKKQQLHIEQQQKIEVGLLLNFGPKPQLIRRIFTNDKKINHG